MLPEKNTLPRAEAETAIDEGDHLSRASQCHFNMARHIIGPFVGMGSLYSKNGVESG